MWEKPRAQYEAFKGVALIGRDMLIRGSVQSDQDIYIDGAVEGPLEVPNCRLTIGPHGKADSGARARQLDLQGVLAGDVEASGTISIRSGARLVGNVRTAGIVIEDGAYFKGSIDIITRRPPRPVTEVAAGGPGVDAGADEG